jgi:multidrug efflux pump subunit AcrA (membrane-fusion protein)
MPTENKTAQGANRRRLSPRLRLALKLAAVAAVLIVGGRWLIGGQTENSLGGTTFNVARGPLEIAVLEGGTIEAKESQELKCEVQGETKILSIVEEGSFVTQEDVDKGLVLVELDSKQLMDRQTEQELQYQNAKASFAEAKEQFDIQKNQNESDIKAAELAVKFANMDLDMYLGAKVTREVIDLLGLHMPKPEDMPTFEEATAALDASLPKPVGEEERLGRRGPRPRGERDGGGENREGGTDSTAAPAGGDTASVSALPTHPSEKGAAEAVSVASAPSADAPVEDAPVKSALAASVDYAKYADPELLGDGKARQDLRKFENTLVLANEEVSLASTKLEGTRRLFEKEFVTKNDLDTEELGLQGKTINRESAETSKELFIKYEFPKEAEKLVAEYEEALRKLERAHKLAVSKLAQAEARLNSAEAQFTLQTRKRREFEEQIEKCQIRAEKPGLVVYGGGEDRYYRQERIEEGSQIRERQVIITIPDTSVMVVKAKVHESYVKKIQKGQKVRIKVDAYPEEQLTGSVDRIAVLPDSQNRWMNPDLKVYDTRVVIDGTSDWIKPGMSAEVEIIVAQLSEVLYIPLQAVNNENGEQVCYVAGLTGNARRVIKTGEFNDSFIEVKSGLEPGDRVLLRAPVEPETGSTDQTPQKTEEEAAPAAEAAVEKKTG